jgi:hypothetical protein
MYFLYTHTQKELILIIHMYLSFSRSIVHSVDPPSAVKVHVPLNPPPMQKSSYLETDLLDALYIMCGFELHSCDI